MNVFILAGIVGIAVIMVGMLLAAAFVFLGRLVSANQEALAATPSTNSVAQKVGLDVPVDASYEEQLRAARRLAAQRAAALPRGAKPHIGRLGQSELRTASQALADDPMTAVRIAAMHTWEGALAGPPAGGVPQQAAVQQKAAPVITKKPEDLVPGKDYPYTEITDDMTPQQVRQARIANSKARSAAIKALKEQAAEAPAAAPATPAASPTAEQAAPAAAGIPEPDYIEITDDMPADEVRKARIHNARARSAYMKALKEAGVEPGAATPEQPQAQQQAPPSQAAPVIPDVEPPNYIEISDEMSPDELRKARVQNARERSRFYKALKERGIDPKEYEAAQEAGEATPAPAAQPQQEPTAPAEAAEPVEAAAADGGGVEIPAHITEPDYIEITDDMPADEMRRARVHNARERSRYAKALKDAGIDPKEVIG